jgi:hypothetical protein
MFQRAATRKVEDTMEGDAMEQGIARRSAGVYLPISIAAGLLFLIAASVAGEYPTVARIGGAVWVGTLSLIVSMPLVTARVKARARGRGVDRDAKLP